MSVALRRALRALILSTVPLVIATYGYIRYVGRPPAVEDYSSAGSIKAPEPATMVALSPDNRLAALGDSRGVSIWSVAGRITLSSIPSPKDFMGTNCITFLGSRPLVAFGGLSDDYLSRTSGGRLYIADINTGKIRWRFHTPDSINCLESSPDGKWLAASGPGGMLRIYDVVSGKLFRELQAQGPRQDRINACAFSKDGKLLVTAGNFADTPVWDTRTWKVLRKLHNTLVADALEVTPDGKYAYFVISDGTIQKCSMTTGKLLSTHRFGTSAGHPAISDTLPRTHKIRTSMGYPAISNDCRIAAFASYNEEWTSLGIVDLTTNQYHQSNAQSRDTQRIYLSRAGEFLLIAEGTNFNDGQILFWQKRKNVDTNLSVKN